MPQNHSQSTEIGGHRYTVSMLDPLTAEDLLVLVVNVVGPSIGAVAGSVKSENEPVPREAIEAAIAGFCQRISKAQLREVIAMLTPVTTVEIAGKTPALDRIFSEHFRGRLGALNRWLLFAIKVQLGDFFDSAAGGIGNGLQWIRAATSHQSSPNTTDEPPG